MTSFWSYFETIVLATFHVFATLCNIIWPFCCNHLVSYPRTRGTWQKWSVHTWLRKKHNCMCTMLHHVQAWLSVIRCDSWKTIWLYERIVFEGKTVLKIVFWTLCIYIYYNIVPFIAGKIQTMAGGFPAIASASWRTLWGKWDMPHSNCHCHIVVYPPIILGHFWTCPHWGWSSQPSTVRRCQEDDSPGL